MTAETTSPTPASASIVPLWLKAGPSADLAQDWMKAVFTPANILVGLGIRWTTTYFQYLTRFANAGTPEERLKVQEGWLRDCANMFVDSTCQMDKAALDSAKETARDVARSIEVEAVTSAATV